MAWVAVDQCGAEYIMESDPAPIQEYYDGYYWTPKNPDDNIIEMPKGSIKKLIGRDLTWEDEPVKLE